MEPIYHEDKGYSGRTYGFFNCGKCNCLLANHKEDLSNFCHNCGERIDNTVSKRSVCKDEG